MWYKIYIAGASWHMFDNKKLRNKNFIEQELPIIKNQTLGIHDCIKILQYEEYLQIIPNNIHTFVIKHAVTDIIKVRMRLTKRKKQTLLTIFLYTVKKFYYVIS